MHVVYLTLTRTVGNLTGHKSKESIILYDWHHMKGCLTAYAKRKDLDQPAHLCSLMRVFPYCIDHISNLEILKKKREDAGQLVQQYRLIRKMEITDQNSHKMTKTGYI